MIGILSDVQPDGLVRLLRSCGNNNKKRGLYKWQKENAAV